MAIYHLNAKVISRSKGQSATAAAAYRAAAKISDQRTGLTFDYTRKKGVAATEIVAPDHAPDWVRDRSQLWNAAELIEKRKNSRTARELDIALPVELNPQQQRELVRGFVTEQLVSQGLVADVAFHNLNSHNPHTHILLTTRPIEAAGFGAKDRNLDRKNFLLELRESWQIHANRALEQAGADQRLDGRTLEAQGLNRLPQIHLGPNVAAMMGKNLATERGDTYLAIQVANQEIEALESQITALEKTLAIEGQPTPETAKLYQATATISQLLGHFGQKTPAGWEFQGNKLYDYHADSDFQTVALYARDGRGLILKQENGQVTGKLTAEDFDNLQQLQKRLQPEIDRRAREVAQISLAALQIAGKQLPEKIARRGGWTRLEGHRYTYQVSDDGQTLEIEAQDGRGTILRQQGEQIESQLRANDLKQFKQIQQAIEQILSENPKKQPRETTELEY